MSRTRVGVTMAAMVLACIAFGLTMALPVSSHPTGGEAFLRKADFDLVFASENAASQS